MDRAPGHRCGHGLFSARKAEHGQHTERGLIEPCGRRHSEARSCRRRTRKVSSTEGSRRLRRDEVNLKEQPDGALAQAPGQARCIVDGQVVELPGEAESAFQDERVEVRVEPQRVAEAQVGDDGSGGDRLAGRGGGLGATARRGCSRYGFSGGTHCRPCRSLPGAWTCSPGGSLLPAACR